MQETTSKSVRYHALDIWRGIVCLVVVLEHAGVALWSVARDEVSPGMEWFRDLIVRSLSLNIGAPLFFVISGYCIAASLDSTRRKGIKPATFLARRLWRIFPPYWASMLVIGGLVVFLNAVGLRSWHETSIGLELFDPSSFSPSQWFGNITLTETWRRCVAVGPDPKLLNRVAWALCYQEQFYLICFLALVVFPKRLYGALAGATLLIVGFRAATVDIGMAPRFLGLFPDLWHEFAVGLFLYWRINVAATFWSRRVVEALFVAVLAAGLQSMVVSTQAAALFGLLLLVCHRWDLAIARVQRFDPLRALGKRSYSVYLIHLPVCTIGNAALAQAGLNGFWSRSLVMIPAVTLGSVVAGWLFYALIDRHFSNLPIVGRFSRLIRATPIGGSIPHAQV